MASLNIIRLCRVNVSKFPQQQYHMSVFCDPADWFYRIVYPADWFYRIVYPADWFYRIVYPAGCPVAGELGNTRIL